MSSPYTNSHAHSPYSFRAVGSIQEMVDLADKDGVKVLGINDFYSMNGFSKFFNLAIKKKIFPMLNVESVALNKEYQQNSVRVNDPSNPVRMYLVGEGYEPSRRTIAKIRNRHSVTD